MSNSSFKDVRNLKKNSVTMRFTNLEAGKDKENPKKQQGDKPAATKEGYLEDHKIKDFDNKLQQHKSEIQRNNSVISELSQGLTVVRDELIRQTQKAEGEQKKCKLLKDEIEKTNKLLKHKTQKLEQTAKKLQAREKDLSDSKSSTQKNSQLNKQVAALQKKVAQLQKSLGDAQTEKRNITNDRDYQIHQLRNSLTLAQNKYQQSQQLRNNVCQKEEQISTLKSQQSLLSQQVERQRRASVQLLQDNSSLQEKLKQLLDQSKTRQTLVEELSRAKSQGQQLIKKVGEYQQTRSHLQKTEQFLRKKSLQYEELSLKYTGAYQQHTQETRRFEEQVNRNRAQIKSLEEQVRTLKQDQLLNVNQLEQFSNANKQLLAIREKSGKLQTLYKQLLPPLKCCLCTKELDKPVTVIPCGHNYCLNCKRGYSKSCLTCGPNLKIQAVYRNELLDDIVRVVRDIKEMLALVG